MKLFYTTLTSLSLALSANFASADSVLFVGNSFTYGYGSAVKYYRPDTVTDLNNQGIGGVPALFKAFTDQAGLDFDVYLETEPGSNFDFHLEKKRGIIGRRPWDIVVLQGHSTLDSAEHGNPDKLIATSAQMSELLLSRNEDVDIYLTSTWSRADMTHQANHVWSGKPIAQMALDLRAGYEKAAANAAGVVSVNPVGEAWTQAMTLGLADDNPYNGLEYGKIDLWTFDHYHASAYGSYLEALVVFGNVTGIDPRSLGQNECAGFELGMQNIVVKGLQEAAYRQLAEDGRVEAAPLTIPAGIQGQACTPSR